VSAGGRGYGTRSMSDEFDEGDFAHSGGGGGGRDRGR
jgi:hypothetical protein